jgi:hypothetical protein
MRRGGNNYTYHMEMVPWPWLMTNGSGAAAERYDYEDFGDPHILDGAGAPLLSSAIGNPYLFGRRRFDGESGLYLCRGGDGDHDFNRDCLSCLYMFDPKIGASLQRESHHAFCAWSMDVKIEGQNRARALYYVDPWEWTGTDGWVPIPIDP